MTDPGQEREALEAAASAIRKAQDGFTEDPAVIAGILEAGDVADYLATKAIDAYRAGLAAREEPPNRDHESLVEIERQAEYARVHGGEGKALISIRNLARAVLAHEDLPPLAAREGVASQIGEPKR
jgi:hypothetical protein